VALGIGLGVVAIGAPALGQDRRDRSDEDEDRGTIERVTITVDTVPVETDVRIGSHRIRRGFSIDVDEGGTGIVRVFADAVVPADRRIAGDVVAVFGSVEVLGEVEGDVVAVMGSVHLRDSAMVDGDVVSVGGALDQAETATVSGESVSLGFMPISWGLPALPVMVGMIVAGWLAAMFSGWVFAALFPARLVRVAATASRRTAASFFLGLLSLPAAVVILVLLFVTVIGIPLALLLPVVYGLIGYAGQLAASYVLGCKLVRRPLGGGPGLLTPLVAGTLFVALFFVIGSMLAVMPGLARPAALFFVMLGTLLIMSLTAIGTGAFLLSRLGTVPTDVGWPGRDPIPAPPPPGALGDLPSPTT
jgi:hypothetical protein